MFKVYLNVDSKECRYRFRILKEFKTFKKARKYVVKRLKKIACEFDTFKYEIGDTHLGVLDISAMDPNDITSMDYKDVTIWYDIEELR